jgi:hypothetical protein
MARFTGKVGFSRNVETSPDVFADVITVRPYKGDIIRDNTSINVDTEIQGEVSTSHSISLVADGYAIEHLQEVRFVEWDGGFWSVATVQRQSPRLILGLGGVYNGPKA